MAECEVRLFTDGACSGNPGPGGWAYIIEHIPSGKRNSGSGGERTTTNNQMELTAVIRGLETLKRSCSVELVTDSQYVAKGLSEWMPKWKAKGWKRGRKEVKNLVLWKQLDHLNSQHQIRCTHVYGHSGHPENEECDQMAVEAYQQWV